MAAKSRTKAQREQDLVKISERYLKGERQVDMAADLNLSQAQISYDLKTIRERWLKEMVDNFNERKALELAKIDRLETEYWRAWEGSRKERKKSTSRKAKKGTDETQEAVIKVEEHIGDHRYLQGVQWCIEERLKIFGVYDADQRDKDWKDWLREHGHDPDTLVSEFVSFMGAERNRRGGGAATGGESGASSGQ